MSWLILHSEKQQPSSSSRRSSAVTQHPSGPVGPGIENWLSCLSNKSGEASCHRVQSCPHPVIILYKFILIVEVCSNGYCLFFDNTVMITADCTAWVLSTTELVTSWIITIVLYCELVEPNRSKTLKKWTYRDDPVYLFYFLFHIIKYVYYYLIYYAIVNTKCAYCTILIKISVYLFCIYIRHASKYDLQRLFAIIYYMMFLVV